MQFMHTLTYKEDDLHRLLMSLEKETSAKMISRTWILFVGHVPARFICWLSPFLMPDVSPIACRGILECHKLLSSSMMIAHVQFSPWETRFLSSQHLILSSLPRNSAKQGALLWLTPLVLLQNSLWIQCVPLLSCWEYWSLDCSFSHIWQPDRACSHSVTQECWHDANFQLGVSCYISAAVVWGHICSFLAVRLLVYPSTVVSHH